MSALKPRYTHTLKHSKKYALEKILPFLATQSGGNIFSVHTADMLRMVILGCYLVSKWKLE